MTKIDIEALAREAGFGFNADHGDYPLDDTAIVGGIENLQAFAALLLEKVAQSHDEAAKEWARMAEGCNHGMYDHKAMAAQQLADDVRQMADGMGDE